MFKLLVLYENIKRSYTLNQILKKIILILIAIILGMDIALKIAKN